MTNSQHDVKVISHDLVSLIIALGVWLVSAFLYPYLPDQIPSHWNLQGEVDGYSSKFVGAFVLSAIPLGIYLMMTYLPKLDPRNSNYLKFKGPYSVFRMAITLIMALIQILVLLTALGYSIDVSMIIRIVLPIMFLLLGNFMGKIRHNYFIGVRTPWTLASEDNWNKTNRLAGRLLVVGSLAGFAGAFLPAKAGMIVFLAGVIAPFVIATVYSYLLFAKATSAD